MVEFDFAVKEDVGAHSLLLQCFDHDMIGKGINQCYYCLGAISHKQSSDDFVGENTISLKDYTDGTTHNQWFTLSDKKGASRGEIRLELTHIKT